MKDNLLKFSTLLCDYRTRVIHTQFALDGRNKAQRRYKRGYISETELHAAVGVYDRAKAEEDALYEQLHKLFAGSQKGGAA